MGLRALVDSVAPRPVVAAAAPVLPVPVALRRGTAVACPRLVPRFRAVRVARSARFRKQTYDKPRGPIKQRPVSRLYDDERRILVETATVDFDDVSKAADDAPDADGPDVMSGTTTRTTTSELHALNEARGPAAVAGPVRVVPLRVRRPLPGTPSCSRNSRR